MRCCAIDGVPLPISGCHGWLTVVGDVGFEMLAHLDNIHQGRGNEEKEVCVCVFGEGMW